MDHQYSLIPDWISLIIKFFCNRHETCERDRKKKEKKNQNEEKKTSKNTTCMREGKCVGKQVPDPNDGGSKSSSIYLESNTLAT